MTHFVLQRDANVVGGEASDSHLQIKRLEQGIERFGIGGLRDQAARLEVLDD